MLATRVGPLPGLVAQALDDGRALAGEGHLEDCDADVVVDQLDVEHARLAGLHHPQRARRAGGQLEGGEVVRARPAVQDVVAGAADQPVVATVAGDRVVADAAVDGHLAGEVHARRRGHVDDVVGRRAADEARADVQRPVDGHERAVLRPVDVEVQVLDPAQGVGAQARGEAHPGDHGPAVVAQRHGEDVAGDAVLHELDLHLAGLGAFHDLQGPGRAGRQAEGGDVVARPAVEPVRARPADQVVVAAQAREGVVARAAVQRPVPAATAADHIVAVAAVHADLDGVRVRIEARQVDRVAAQAALHEGPAVGDRVHPRREVHRQEQPGRRIGLVGGEVQFLNIGERVRPGRGQRTQALHGGAARAIDGDLVEVGGDAAVDQLDHELAGGFHEPQRADGAHGQAEGRHVTAGAAVEDVVALPAQQVVVAAQALQPVVAVAAVQRLVGTGMAHDGVVPQLAVHGQPDRSVRVRIKRAQLDDVVARGARDEGEAAAHLAGDDLEVDPRELAGPLGLVDEEVQLLHARHGVRAELRSEVQALDGGRAAHHRDPEDVGDGVPVHQLDQDLAGPGARRETQDACGPRGQRIAGDVVSRATVEGVVAGVTGEAVVVRAAHQGVVALAAEQAVVPRQAVQAVGARAAHHVVVPGSPEVSHGAHSLIARGALRALTTAIGPMRFPHPSRRAAGP